MFTGLPPVLSNLRLVQKKTKARLERFASKSFATMGLSKLLRQYYYETDRCKSDKSWLVRILNQLIRKYQDFYKSKGGVILTNDRES